MILTAPFLPPQWRGVVGTSERGTNAADMDVDGGAEDDSETQKESRGGTVFVAGEERFAESYPAASILFAESAGPWVPSVKKKKKKKNGTSPPDSAPCFSSQAFP